MKTIDDSFKEKLCECGNYVEDVSSLTDTLPICRNCHGIPKCYYDRLKKEYETSKKEPVCFFDTYSKMHYMKEREKEKQ